MFGFMLQLSQLEEEAPPHGLLFLDGEDGLVVDCAVGLEPFEEGFDIVGMMSEIGGGGLGFLVAAVVAFDEVVFCLFLQSFQNHFGVGFGFAHSVQISN